MGLELFAFWALVLVALELLAAPTLAYALGSGLLLLLLVIARLLSAEFDLLASMLVALYSSVFVFLSLLALHLGSYGMPAAQAAAPRPLYSGAAPLLLAGCGALLPAGQPGSRAAPVVSTPWVGFYAESRSTTPLQAGLLHWVFYRAFVLEALWLNLYLLLALALAIAVLGLLRSTGGAGTARVRGWRHGARAGLVQNERIRLTARFRRQTRRKGASVVRF